MSQDATHLGSFLDAYSLIVIDLSCLFLRFGISWPFSCFFFFFFMFLTFSWLWSFVVLFLRALFLDEVGYWCLIVGFERVLRVCLHLSCIGSLSCCLALGVLYYLSSMLKAKKKGGGRGGGKGGGGLVSLRFLVFASLITLEVFLGYHTLVIYWVLCDTF